MTHTKSNKNKIFVLLIHVPLHSHFWESSVLNYKILVILVGHVSVTLKNHDNREKYGEAPPRTLIVQLWER